MILQFKKIRFQGIKERIKSTVNLNTKEKFNTNYTEGILDFSVEYSTNTSLGVSQIMKYAKFTNTYYILKSEESERVYFFGFKKVKGIKLCLVEKEYYENEIKRTSEKDYILNSKLLGSSPYSHIAFIADNLKEFYIEENFQNGKSINVF